MVSFDSEHQEMFPTQLLEFIKGLLPLTVILVLQKSNQEVNQGIIDML